MYVQANLVEQNRLGLILYETLMEIFMGIQNCVIMLIWSQRIEEAEGLFSKIASLFDKQ